MVKYRIFLCLKVLLSIRGILFFVFIVLSVPYRPWVIHSEKAMNILSVLGGFDKSTAKGAAIFPIMILRFDNHPMNETRVRHEAIHHYQQIETLYLVGVYSFFENLYATYVLGYSHMDAYLYETVEQEAYLNQTDPSYLERRPIFGFWPYMRHKRKFKLVDYKVVFTD